jgi:hypothetical protein
MHDDHPATLFVALDLSRSSWVVAVHAPHAGKVSRHSGGGERRWPSTARRMSRGRGRGGSPTPPGPSMPAGPIHAPRSRAACNR